MTKYTCPCCGYKVFEEAPGSYDICPICFWEDDIVQLFYLADGGANINLIDAQNNYERIGASEERFLERVRKSFDTDEEDQQWRKVDVAKDKLEDLSNYWEGVKNTIDKKPEYYWLLN